MFLMYVYFKFDVLKALMVYLSLIKSKIVNENIYKAKMMLNDLPIPFLDID